LTIEYGLRLHLLVVCAWQDGDLFGFEDASGRRSTTSEAGQLHIQDDLRYTTEPDETAIESPVTMRDLQYTTSLMHAAAHDQQQQQQQVTAFA